MHAFHGKSDCYIYLPLEHQGNKDCLLVSFEATSTNNVDPDQVASVAAV